MKEPQPLRGIETIGVSPMLPALPRNSRNSPLPFLPPLPPQQGVHGPGVDSPAVGEGRISTSRDDVRLRPRNQARWRMRQCFRTASRDAYSLPHPGCLQVKRWVLPQMVILQQSTAAIPLVGS